MKLFILFSLLSFSINSFADEDLIQVNELIGKATVNLNDDVKELKSGMFVEPGSIISTEKIGILILSLSDGSIVKVDSESVFRINNKLDGKIPSFTLEEGGITIQGEGNYGHVEFINPSNTHIGIQKGLYLVFNDNVTGNNYITVKKGSAKVKGFKGQKDIKVIQDHTVILFEDRMLTKPDIHSWQHRFRWFMDPKKGTLPSRWADTRGHRLRFLERKAKKLSGQLREDEVKEKKGSKNVKKKNEIDSVDPSKPLPKKKIEFTSTRAKAYEVCLEAQDNGVDCSVQDFPCPGGTFIVEKITAKGQRTFFACGTPKKVESH